MPIKTEPFTEDEIKYIKAALAYLTCGELRNAPAPSLKKFEHIAQKIEYIYEKQQKEKK